MSKFKQFLAESDLNTGRAVIARGKEGDSGDSDHLSITDTWVKPGDPSTKLFKSTPKAEKYLDQLAKEKDWDMDDDGFYMNGKWEIYTNTQKTKLKESTPNVIHVIHAAEAWQKRYDASEGGHGWDEKDEEMLQDAAALIDKMIDIIASYS